MKKSSKTKLAKKIPMQYVAMTEFMELRKNLESRVLRLDLLTSAIHRLFVTELKLCTEKHLQELVEFEQTRAKKYQEIMMDTKMSWRDKLDVCKEYSIPLQVTPIPHFIRIDPHLSDKEKVSLSVEFGFSLEETAPEGQPSKT